MADFDPYHKWLGIPKTRRPPTHYDLLGLSLDEEDREVIRGAAEQRRRFIESRRGQGQDGAVGGVVYQINEAEFTLLAPDMRREYDRRMNLFTKRKRKRQIDPNAVRPQIQSMPGRTVGEESGLTKEFAGIVAVLALSFFGMAAAAFSLPWGTSPPVRDHKAHQQMAPVAMNQPVVAAAAPMAEAAPPEQIVPVRQPVRQIPPDPPPVVPAPQEKERGFISLFDGQSLNGWRLYTGGPVVQGWVVEDGLLCLKGGQGANLITERQFEDFELELEWKTSAGNSGILYRVRTGDPFPHQSGLEYQILGRNYPRSQTFPSGSLYGLFEADPRAVQPVDEFNHARILVRGSHLEHWLNGRKVVDADRQSRTWEQAVTKSNLSRWPQFAKARRGHICLQSSDADVFFKNIRIRDLLKPVP
ncbi:MAG TPA: DUF1080 domain-containing protein [Planctomicrobium sp.]|nr:DUF1080 domain-containing protein [Planctomicrobium sp.]